MAGIILDAGPLYAVLDQRDKFHLWATDQLRHLPGPYLTCDAVLSETFFLISSNSQSHRQLHILLKKCLIIPDFNSKSQIPNILDLMETYRNVPMSFADACLVCMVENNPGSTLFTLDRDFAIYRQQRRRIIPLLAPF